MASRARSIPLRSTALSFEMNDRLSNAPWSSLVIDRTFARAWLNRPGEHGSSGISATSGFVSVANYKAGARSKPGGWSPYPTIA